MTTESQVYRFRIQLDGIAPPVWRTIELPETYTFWDLHVAVQDAMGWQDYHLHEFQMRGPPKIAGASGDTKRSALTGTKSCGSTTLTLIRTSSTQPR